MVPGGGAVSYERGTPVLACLGARPNLALKVSPSQLYSRVGCTLGVVDMQHTTHTQFKNNCFTEMCSGSREGSYLRLIVFRVARYERSGAFLRNEVLMFLACLVCEKHGLKGLRIIRLT